MNAWPTSAPVTSSRSHHEVDESSSRNSLRSTAYHSAGADRDSGERKEHLLERRVPVLAEPGVDTQFVQRALTDGTAAAQQHEAIAHAHRIAKLVDRQEECASRARFGAQHGHRLARLPQVEPVERFIQEQQWLSRQKPHREQDALVLTLGQGAEPAVPQMANAE